MHDVDKEPSFLPFKPPENLLKFFLSIPDKPTLLLLGFARLAQNETYDQSTSHDGNKEHSLL